MPGNTIKINNEDKLEWYIGDSKINELTDWLDKNGIKTKDVDLPGTNDKEIFKGDLLKIWLEELIYPGKVDDFVQHVGGSNDPDRGIWKLTVCFFTNEHKYQIVAIDRKDDEGYLGCQVSTRKYRAGEDHLRGNDLPDGPFIRATWDRILNAIIRYELVQLSPFRRPETKPVAIEDK